MSVVQIVVPMAGRGSRFADRGYTLPKALIDVAGRPMIDVVIRNLRPVAAHRFVFVVQAAQLRAHELGARLAEWAPGCRIATVDGVTEGAACTVLAAEPLLDADAPLMIANCDQWVDIDIDRYLGAFSASGADGTMLTMEAHDPKWSFVEPRADGTVARVVEKQVISDIATVGVYNFARAGDFCSGARQMIAAERRVNGEFYVAPVYNELIDAGARITWYPVAADGAGMHGLGTPDDLDAFLASAHVAKAVDGRECTVAT